MLFFIMCFFICFLPMCFLPMEPLILSLLAGAAASPLGAGVASCANAAPSPNIETALAKMSDFLKDVIIFSLDLLAA